MNLIEAIKSGRPFRRKNRGWDWVISNKDGDGWIASNRSPTMNLLEPRDLLADDWEIQEPSVAITRTQFLLAAGFVPAGPDRWRFVGEGSPEAAIRELSRKLGLEP